MSYFDDFDTQVQCEEFFIAERLSKWDALMDTIDEMESEDVMDKCEVQSLEHLPEGAGTYNMEGILVEEMVADDYYDDYYQHEGERLKAMSWEHREASIYGRMM
jgi:hypothetical protein